MNLKPISEDPEPFIASVESAAEVRRREHDRSITRYLDRIVSDRDDKGAHPPNRWGK